MWALLALFATIVSAMENVLQKKSTLHFNAFQITWAILVVSSLFYLPILIHVGIPSHLGHLFWVAVVARVIVDSAALVLFIKALQLAQLSLAIPMMSFQPIFVIFVSLLINHLFPSPLGIAGVVIVAFGVYLLNFDHENKKLLSPFKNILREKGILLMLISCLLWSFVTALQRLGIDNSNVAFYTSFFQPFWALCFLPLAFFSNPKSFKRLFHGSSLKLLAPIGILDAVQILAQNFAYSLTLPVYVTAIQSTSILFAAIFGFYFFKESIREKIFPTLIILIGVIGITLSS